MIKKLFFTAIYASSSLVWANPQVTLASGTVLKNCFYESSPQSVLCSDDKNPSKKIIIYQTNNGIVAL